MKKLNVILLIFSFVLSGLGGLFLFDTNASIQEKTNAPINKAEDIIYTFKTYEDYFIDYFNLPTDLYVKDDEASMVTINFAGISRKTQNGQTQLSYNGNVFYTVTENDLIGSGTENNPYIIKSLNGFLYLLNNNMSKISLSNKYVELACDIVLNNETFDENGEPSGGDGIVYSFNYFTQTIYFFDGNGYFVKGFYYKDTTQTKSVSLFHKLEYLQNVNMENYYMEGKYVRGLSCSTVTNILNCSVSGGYMYASSEVSGIAYSANNIQDCISNSTLYGGGRGSGLVKTLKKSAINCKNYSNIKVDTEQVAGLIHTIETSKGIEVVLENCVNYGTVEGVKTDYTAGIVGDTMYDMFVTMKNCANYGKIIGSKYTASIIAMARGILNLHNCLSEAIIEGSAIAHTGEFIAIPFINIIITINECEVKSNNDCSFIALPYSTSISNYISISIVDTKISLRNSSTNSYAGVFVREARELDFLKIKNCIVDIYGDSSDGKKLISADRRSSNNPTKDIEISNVLVMVKDMQKSVEITNKIYEGDIYKIDGIICQLSDRNEYYGSNFSGYFFSWRTWQIGLISFDGRGQFQGKIDEEWLKNNGYEKKSV